MSALLAHISIAQESKTTSSAPEKKYAITLGASYSSYACGLGGNLKMDYLKSYKLGLGLKTVAATNRFQDINIPSSHQITNAPGINFLSDLTLTYYVIGDYCNSKGGIYADLGFGYHTKKTNYTMQFTGTPSFKVNETESGLGWHLSLGGSYKLGPGKIYLGAMVRGIEKGTLVHSETYPDGYPGLSTGTPTPNWGGNYKYSNWKNFNYLFNLGYSFCF